MYPTSPYTPLPPIRHPVPPAAASATGQSAESLVPSADQLRGMHIPPLACEVADIEGNALIFDFFKSGMMPQCAAQVKAVAVFCVKNNLLPALSWLVVQCNLDRPQPWKVDLNRCELNNADAQTVANWARTADVKIALDLGGNCIGDEGAMALAETLSGQSAVLSLSLQNNPVGYWGVAELAKMLHGNASLVELDLCGTGIGNDQAAHIAFALKNNTKLRCLHLDENSILKAGAEFLADALKSNHSLRILTLSGNPLSSNRPSIFDADDEEDKGRRDVAKAFAGMLEINTTLFVLALGIDTEDQECISSLQQIQRKTSKRLEDASASFSELAAQSPSLAGLSIDPAGLIVNSLVSQGAAGVQAAEAIMGLADLVKLPIAGAATPPAAGSGENGS